MIGVMLGLIALFAFLGLFMWEIWKGIKTDSAKYDLEFLWEDYAEIIEKEKVL